MARKKREDVLDSYFGIPVTSHDFKEFTTTEERRGYRAATIGSAVGVVVFAVLAVFRLGSELGPGVWWTLALVCVGLFFAYFPIGYGSVAREARPKRELVATLDPDRVSTFWYERGVTDETPEYTVDELDRRDEHRPPGH